MVLFTNKRATHGAEYFRFSSIIGKDGGEGVATFGHIAFPCIFSSANCFSR